MLLYMAMIQEKEDALRFEELYQRYHRQMYYEIYNILRNPQEAEDVLQETLLNLARNIKTVPADEPKALRAYVLTAAKHGALRQQQKSKSKKRAISLEELDVELAADEDLFKKLEAAEDYALLMRAMRQLESPYLETLMLAYVHEQSIRQIATVLGRKEGTVRQHLRRGKKQLIALCEKEGFSFYE